ncbi:MAG TPA: DUF1491 family protein, partial [Sphingomicrobium sp.]|nr:DUF1491 family protein [Sphingomicrobium sp.]
MNDRLPASVEATALMRRAQSEGGFATLLKKGDADRGAILLVVRGRDGHVACLERVLSMDGAYAWQPSGPAESASDQDLAEFLQRRGQFDEDLWIIEL